MPQKTPYTSAVSKAADHLSRGFDLAWQRAGKVPLGEDILDPRTMARRDVTNIAASIAGETAGLPQTARAVFQRQSNVNKIKADGQTDKNKKAGIVVDPTTIEMHTGADPTSIDTVGGYGVTGMPAALTGNSGGNG